MKISNRILENWTIRAQCTGDGFNVCSPCNHFLQLGYKDIVYRKFIRNFVFFKITGTTYGFICNICHCFTPIDKSFIPNELKHSCPQVADINSPFYQELSPKEKELSMALYAPSKDLVPLKREESL